MKKRLLSVLLCLLVSHPFTVNAISFEGAVYGEFLMSNVLKQEQWSRYLISDNAEQLNNNLARGVLLSALVEFNDNGTNAGYFFDYSIIYKLDLSLSRTLYEHDSILQSYQFHYSVCDVAAALNITLASIYYRYLERTIIPVQNPLWLIALGSVEYNYPGNDQGLIFSFPVDMEAAAADPNYLLRYCWREVKRIGGDEAVLRRDGSSIGMLQITSGFGLNVDPVIPEEFGIFGSVEGRRTDVWVTLGDGTESGDSIIWHPGVNGDRWSPADNANIIYAVYDAALRRRPLSPYLMTKYEQVIILMWAHNRGMSILHNQSFIERSIALSAYVPRMREFATLHRPSRFTRSNIMMAEVRSIANSATGGDIFPVASLMSYIITEARFAGKW